MPMRSRTKKSNNNNNNNNHHAHEAMDVSCQLCHVASPPVEAVEGACGHLFCWNCVVARGVTKCGAVGCTQAVSAVSVGELSRSAREVLLRETRRTPCERGCGAQLLLREMQDHADNQCSEGLVSCPNGCGVEPPKRRLLDLHTTEECQLRIVACPNGCPSRITRKDLNRHVIEECANTPASCDNKGCDAVLTRGTAAEHASCCPVAPVPCDFAAGGCTDVILRKDKNEHVSGQVSEHLSMVGSMMKGKVDLASLSALEERVNQLEAKALGENNDAGSDSGDGSVFAWSGKRGRCRSSCKVNCCANPALARLRSVVGDATANFTWANYLMVFIIALIFAGFPTIVPALGSFLVYRRYAAQGPIAAGSTPHSCENTAPLTLMLGLGLAAVLC